MDGLSPSASGTMSTPSQVPLESYPPQLLAPVALTHETAGPALEGTDATKPRSLNGVHVSAEEIDDLFKLYYARASVHLVWDHGSHELLDSSVNMRSFSQFSIHIPRRICIIPSPRFSFGPW